MVKLSREEIDAFLEDDAPIRQRIRLESALSFGWVFAACFAYSVIFVFIFLITAQVYGAEFYVNMATLPADRQEALAATTEILQIRSFVAVVLLFGTSTAFLFRRGFLVMLIISLSYTLNALLQTWAFSRALGVEHIAFGGLLVEIGGLVFLFVMMLGGWIYWSRRGRDIYLDF